MRRLLATASVLLLTTACTDLPSELVDTVSGDFQTASSVVLPGGRGVQLISEQMSCEGTGWDVCRGTPVRPPMTAIPETLLPVKVRVGTWVTLGAEVFGSCLGTKDEAKASMINAVGTDLSWSFGGQELSVLESIRWDYAEFTPSTVTPSCEEGNWNLRVLIRYVVIPQRPGTYEFSSEIFGMSATREVSWVRP